MAITQRWIPPVGDTLLKRYRLDECIGNGPTGSVFQATDLVSRQVVVIKALHPELFSPRYLEMNTNRLIRAKALNSRKIARILDLYLEPEEGTPHFLVCEFVEGTNLREFHQLRRKGGNGISHPEIRFILDGIIGALAEIKHPAGHANIKPENVFLTAEGVILTDPYFMSGRTRLKWLPGELPLRDHYLADEQLMRSAEETALSDIFAFGLVMGELVCGEAVRAKIPVTDQGMDVPREADILFLKATQSAPLDRHASLAALQGETSKIFPDSVGEILVEDSDTQVVEADAILSPRQLAEIAAFNRSRRNEQGRRAPTPVHTEDLPFSLEPKSSDKSPSLADEDELDQTMVEDPELVAELMRQASNMERASSIPGVPADASQEVPSPRPLIDRRSRGSETGISTTPPPAPPRSPLGSTTSKNAERLETAMPLSSSGTGRSGNERASDYAEDVVPSVPSMVLDEEEALILDDDISLGEEVNDEDIQIAEPLNETRPHKSSSSTLKRVEPGSTITRKHLSKGRDTSSKPPAPSGRVLASGEAQNSNKAAYLAIGLLALAVIGTAIVVLKPPANSDGETNQSPVASATIDATKGEASEAKGKKEEAIAPLAVVDAGVSQDVVSPADTASEAVAVAVAVAVADVAPLPLEEQPKEEEKAIAADPKPEPPPMTEEEKAAAKAKAEAEAERKRLAAEERKLKREENREAKQIAAKEKKAKKAEAKALKAEAKADKKAAAKEEKETRSREAAEAKEQMKKAEMAVSSPVKVNTDESRACPKGMKRIATKKTKKIGSRKVVIKSAFCVDYYEYPGKSARPKTNVSWFDASAKCGGKGKRLCSNSEWRQACGAGKKYPYGGEWQASSCNTMSASGKEGKVGKAGSKRNCKSPYGMYDMSGNVSEWTSNKSANGGNASQDGDTASCYRSASRAPGSKSPFVGFRCCADPE